MSIKQAVHWFRLSAEGGNASGQNALGRVFQLGSTVPKDYVEAYKWLYLAQLQGHSLSTSNLERLVPLLTPSQIEEGKRRAVAFVARPGAGKLPEILLNLDLPPR